MEGNNRFSGHSKIKRKRTARKTALPAATLGQVSLQRAGGSSEPPGLLLFTLLVLYKNLYILGVTLMRRRLRSIRRFRVLCRRAKNRVRSLWQGAGHFFAFLWKGAIKRVKAPFFRVQKVYLLHRTSMREKREQGIVPLAEWGEIALSILRLLWSIVATIFNHAAPVIAAYVLLTTVQSNIIRPMGMQVRYNGEAIGYIRNESEFDAAAKTLRDRFIANTGEQAHISTPVFTLTEMEKGVQFSEVDELADEMVRASGSDINWGYGLYIDKVFYGAVEDGDFVLDELENIKLAHTTGLPNEKTEFMKSIQYTFGLYPQSSFVANEYMYNVLHRYETVDEIYISKENDTPTGIAEKLGVPYFLIKELNPGIEEKLDVGQEVLTAKARPFLSVKNLYTAQYEEEFDFPIEEIPTATYTRGYREIAQQGVKGVQLVTAQISDVDGVEIERKILETQTIKEPVVQKVIVGTNDPRTIVSTPPSGSGNTGVVSSAGFMWPTSGGVITVGVAGYAGHTGVDIPRPSGTPIYASASGTVVLAKYGYTNYGNHVMIDHGNGYTTLYAHCSALHVQIGDVVSQGQQIASVGRTGRATGNHLHFEVRQNGRIMNPRNYIG